MGAVCGMCLISVLNLRPNKITQLTIICKLQRKEHGGGFWSEIAWLLFHFAEFCLPWLRWTEDHPQSVWFLLLNISAYIFSVLNVKSVTPCFWQEERLFSYRECLPVGISGTKFWLISWNWLKWPRTLSQIYKLSTSKHFFDEK